MDDSNSAAAGDVLGNPRITLGNEDDGFVGVDADDNDSECRGGLERWLVRRGERRQRPSRASPRWRFYSLQALAKRMVRATKDISRE